MARAARPLRDTQCGLKAFRSDVGQPIFALGRVDGFAFDVEVLHLVERHRLVAGRGAGAARDRERIDGARRRATPLRLLRDLWRIRHWSATGAYELHADDAGDVTVSRLRRRQ